MTHTTPGHPDDRRLLRRFHAGDESAADALWQRHARAMHTAALAALADTGRRDPASADDAVQQALIGILGARRRDVARVRDVRAWLVRCARNAALNIARADARRTTHHSEAARHAHGLNHRPSGPTSPLSPDPALADALAQLRPDERELILLRHGADLTLSQLATVLDLPRGTVATRDRAAHQRLQRLLARHHTPPPDPRSNPHHPHLAHPVQTTPAPRPTPSTTAEPTR